VRKPDDIDEPETVGAKVAEYGLRGTEQFALDRYFRIKGILHDLVQLPRFVTREGFDVVHMHLSHDHSFGALVLRLFSRGRPVLVRSLHKRTVLEQGFGTRMLLGRLADGLTCFTEGFRQQYMERFSLPEEKFAVLPMPVNLDRFRPGQELRDMRAHFGVPADAPLIGIVGRFQKYRKMDVFLPAARKVVDQVPEARFLIIGDSSQIQQTVVQPARELGIADNVVMAGYRTDDYLDTLDCIDIFSLLMPGFDGTARAVREAMALAKPCVVSDFGMLPDVVPNGKAGLVTPLDADALADAWLRLIRNPAERQSMGQFGHEYAQEHFRIDRVGPVLQDFYGRLLAQRR
jgi:glycosyltransferase involved in cell wall biosynthesis